MMQIQVSSSCYPDRQSVRLLWIVVVVVAG
jgi:hypothetical protein